MKDDGVTRAACFVTSAYSSWSSCRQYRENLFDAVSAVPGAPVLDKLRHYFNHPGFVEPVADAVLAALAGLPDAVRDDAHLAFVTHSIPATMADSSGPPGQAPGAAYVAQHLDLAVTVAERLAEETGNRTPTSSSSAHGPARRRCRGSNRMSTTTSRRWRGPLFPRSCWCPSGSSRTTWRSSTTSTPGLGHRRAARAPGPPGGHAGTDSRFVAMVRDLLVERATAERGEDVARVSVGAIGPLWDRCPVGCCPNPRGERPALCGGGFMTVPAQLAAELLDLAVLAARSAGRMIQSGAARGVTVTATKSSDVDVVTESDRSAERLIRRALLEARPDDAVVGEEGDDEAGTTGVRWIVDPIDGTVNFVYGIPQYAVSIAAELDGEVVAGVVLNVATGSEYTATLGGPARRDGVPIQVRATVPLHERLIGTGFSYEAHQREIQAAALLHLLPRIRDIRGSAPAPSTSAEWPRAPSTGTSRRGSTCGPRRRRAGGAGRRSPGRDRPGGRWAADRHRRAGGRIRRVQGCALRGWVPRCPRGVTAE